ncbi:MAG TPA: Mut7-C RNAse domain-containing protein [Nitrososphaerales archaeon]|nr:Mut7-C RNAse domain-containing protein [Nitrososphaerales archaeon]
MPGSSTKRSERQRPRDSGARRPGSTVGTHARTRFIVDAMLGSLARKLRALGFDSAYYRSGEDKGLLERSVLENRIVLTADRPLAARARARGIGTILVVGDSDRERVGSIARGAALSGIRLARGAPLCSLCGGELRPVGKGDVSGEVPPAVSRRHRLFFRCTSCGQVYWRGSHWKKLMSVARRLGQG